MKPKELTKIFMMISNRAKPFGLWVYLIKNQRSKGYNIQILISGKKHGQLSIGRGVRVVQLFI